MILLAQLVPLSIHVTFAICCNRRQENVSMPKYSLMNNETGPLFLEFSWCEKKRFSFQIDSKSLTYCSPLDTLEEVLRNRSLLTNLRFSVLPGFILAHTIYSRPKQLFFNVSCYKIWFVPSFTVSTSNLEINKNTWDNWLRLLTTAQSSTAGCSLKDVSTSQGLIRSLKIIVMIL